MRILGIDPGLRNTGFGVIEVVNHIPKYIISGVISSNNSESLCQARGAAISACVLADLNVFEYTALQVKQAVVGYGHADKLQIQAMVKYLLHLDGSPSSDAADALACALAHMQYSKMQKMLAFSRVKGGRSSS